MQQSKLFGKTVKDVSKDETSVNAQLLLKGGYIHRLMAGIYSFLPLGLMVLERIENIIREEMNAIEGQEVLLPALHPKSNWEQTGRWDVVDVLFRFESYYTKTEYALGPTHEEIITPLAGRTSLSYKDLPFALYQFQTKFRDEKRAKSGILRGREFRMKDLYSFNLDQEDLDNYYERVVEAYHKIFERLGLGEKTLKTFASGGDFTKYSHEFQTITEVGEDLIYVCDKCNVAINQEIIHEQDSCPDCGNKDLKETKAVEVGNIFKLGTRFTDDFNVKYTDKDGKEKPVLMGCYGIGPSRIMGTIVELFNDENGIMWPESIAPFDVHILSLGNSEEVLKKSAELMMQYETEGGEVLWDERDVRPGQKFADADLIGIPLQIIVSEKTIEKGGYEMRMRNDKENVKFVKFED